MFEVVGWGAGQRVLIDSHLAYKAGWASSRRSHPVWPLSTAHFHNISGVSALQADCTTHTHKLCTPLAPCCGGGQGLACHPGSGVRGWGGSMRGERDGKIVFNQSRHSVLLMEKVTALLLPFSSHCNCNFRSFCLSHLYYSTHQM